MRKVLIGAVFLSAAAYMAGLRAQSSVPFSILFDGGYAWIDDKSAGTMEVASLAHHGGGHDMELLVARGTVDSADLAPSNSPEGEYWPLKGWDLRLASYGGEAAGWRMNTPTPPAQPCPPIRDFSVEANNLFFMPKLNDLVPNADIDVSPAKIASRVILERGRLAVRAVTPCWEFRKIGSKPGSGPKQPIASGLAGVKFALVGVPEVVELQLVPRAGGQTKSIRIRAEATGGGAPEITLQVGHHVNFHPDPSHPISILTNGQPIPDFTTFYSLLKTPIPAKDQLIPHKVETIAGTLDTPGKECASIQVVKR